MKKDLDNKTNSAWLPKRLSAELPPVGKHLARFSGHMSCESGNKNVLNCLLASVGHGIKSTRGFKGGSLSR